MKRVILFLLAVACLLSLCACGSEDGTVNVGDTVSFGTYEQDGDASNGKEAIEWTVLAVDGSKALLVSNYALTCRTYNDEFKNITWDDCSLRDWLNNEFYAAAFTSAEQAQIQSVKLENADNRWSDTKGCDDTKDSVFLLSLEEIMEYYNLTEDDIDNRLVVDALKVPYTAVAQEEYDRAAADWGYNEDDFEHLTDEYSSTSDEPYSWWWLRSVGGSNLHAATVLQDGFVRYFGYYVDYTFGAVRPAVWVEF